MNVQRGCDSTTTTTSFRGMPQKYRGYSVRILEVLCNSGGLTTGEIALRTGIDVDQVYQSCKRMYRRGLIEKKERWGWQSLPYGNLVLSVSTTTTTTPFMNHSSTIHEPFMNRSSETRQIDLRAWESREDVDDPQRVVVGVLISHYEKTGIKYRIFADPFEFAEVMGMPIQDVMPAVRKLREDGCIYFRRDVLGWKVGLMKAFVERMQHA